MKFRAWAEKNNETLNFVFTQYLLGNRSFDESALFALEGLMEEDTTKVDGVIGRIEEKMRSLAGVQEGEYQAEEMLEFLEEVMDLLKDQFVATGPKPDLLTAPVGGPGILPDHEITLLARAGMIEPFEPVQVSKVDGRRVLSYGVSSYGYDARVADEFKVFTNTYGTIVDPKNFDDRSFVDVKATDGYIIIPPNSFVLGRTVERFDIPRDVLVVCVGKSTYARCFSGDTRVALLDGTAPTFEELAARSEPVWGYSIGHDGEVVAALLDAPRFVGRDSLLEVTLDNGQVVKATPDHKFLLRDGRTLPAGDLRPGQSLMPLYRQVFRGYEAVYQPLRGFFEATHRLADGWNVKEGLYEASPGTHRHHKDHDRRNNMPWNIERMGASDHIRHHNDEYYGDGFDAKAHGEAVREALALLSQDPTWRENYTRLQREKVRAFWDDERYENARERLRASQVLSWTQDRREKKRAELFRRYADPQALAAHGAKMREAWASADGAESRRERQREVARGINLRTDVTEGAVRDALQRARTIRGAASLLGCDRSTFRRFHHVLDEARSQGVLKNHKVVSVRPLAGDHDVYCLTVPEAGNFALDAGVFVENCGIIVNVTPLEPCWRGHVTLEFSNTTPLPAKLYANEGACQFLFFRGSSPCQTSYSDRKGKYQGQTGVTPPRMVK